MKEKYSDLGTKLRYLVYLLHKDVESCYKDLNLTQYKPQYTAIFRGLMEFKSLTIGEICKITKMSQPRISQTVKDMQKNDLVKPIKTEDARELKICLTSTAKAMIPKLKNQWLATTKATKNLDQELPISLQQLTQTAIECLEKQSFKQRIKQFKDLK